jgi:hypothetical protein
MPPPPTSARKEVPPPPPPLVHDLLPRPTPTDEDIHLNIDGGKDEYGGTNGRDVQDSFYKEIIPEDFKYTI